MKVLGIIAEYNPMHNGHIYHIEESKKITNADYVVLVMSGSFTETGNISTLDKFTKAKIATEYGVDLVIELPTIYSTASSQYFATGAISLLDSLGIVDLVCFGSECNNIQTLENIADKIIQNENNIWEDIKKEEKNKTFAESRNDVLSKYLNEYEIKEITKPNNILGIEYIKAIKKLGSKIKPYTIQRISSDNDTNLHFTSSTNIRKALKNNDIQSIKEYIPKLVYNKLNENNYLLNNNIFELLRYKIISMSKEELTNINEATEGIENRLLKYISATNNYDEFVESIKSKRYIENKIKRLLINILLGINKNKFKVITDSNVNYAHILSFSNNGTLLLSNISKASKIPVFVSINDNIINKQSKEIKYMLNLDIYSSNIHSILTNTNLNKDYTNRI